MEQSDTKCSALCITHNQRLCFAVEHRVNSHVDSVDAERRRNLPASEWPVPTLVYCCDKALFVCEQTRFDVSLSCYI